MVIPVPQDDPKTQLVAYSAPSQTPVSLESVAAPE
jgi:hypothetical protein